MNEKTIDAIVRFIVRHPRYNHSLVKAFCGLAEKGWEEARKEMIRDTDATGRIYNAISYYGRIIDRHGLAMPTADELSFMVLEMSMKRVKAAEKERNRKKQRKGPAPEYYPRLG